MTIVVAFAAAVVGALVGAYLQKLWTPDPRPEIAALGEQVTSFRKRVETIEQERTKEQVEADEWADDWKDWQIR
jgi:hypothetical protein